MTPSSSVGAARISIQTSNAAYRKKIDISKRARDEQDQYKHANIPFQVSHKQQDSLNADGPYFVTIRGVHRWFQQTVLKTNS
jgi:hypothetical protein